MPWYYAGPENMIYPSKLEGFDEKVEEAYIRSRRRDGQVYIPAVIIKPEGEGPFPALLFVHGSPGGRNMNNLKMMIEIRHQIAKRFLKEGYVVIFGSYRWRDRHENEPAGADVASVIRYIKNMSEVDAQKICIYAGSRGAENSIIAMGEETVAAAVLNAPGGYTYFDLVEHKTEEVTDPNAVLPPELYDRAKAVSFLEKINTPTRFVVGTVDPGHLPNVNTTVALLKELGKETSVEVYPGERHGFASGGSMVNNKYTVSPAFPDALEKAVVFFESKIK
jgi:dipeptidyl aminopeptidase/acylaminoacyl peptidase